MGISVKNLFQPRGSDSSCSILNQCFGHVLLDPSGLLWLELLSPEDSSQPESVIQCSSHLGIQA